ncbi:Proline dehydrogenase (Proline oxidase) [Staphylococcus warneri]|nr:Proline dehydrogenase (Proline oxidase) [Staphylococcus warneri]
MRRLAERPQNLSLAVKEFATPETLKKLVFSQLLV